MLKNFKLRKWLVLAASFIIMAVSFSIVNNITSLFLNPVTQKLGVSISSFSLIFTIGAITTALMSPIIGQLIAKFPLGLIMSLGAILAGGGFFCYALATKNLDVLFNCCYCRDWNDMSNNDSNLNRTDTLV